VEDVLPFYVQQRKVFRCYSTGDRCWRCLSPKFSIRKYFNKTLLDYMVHIPVANVVSLLLVQQNLEMVFDHMGEVFLCSFTWRESEKRGKEKKRRKRTNLCRSSTTEPDR